MILKPLGSTTRGTSGHCFVGRKEEEEVIARVRGRALLPSIRSYSVTINNSVLYLLMLFFTKLQGNRGDFIDVGDC